MNTLPRNSGDLVGFMDLGDPMTNFACLDDKDIIATHALAFLVRGLCTDVKHHCIFLYRKCHFIPADANFLESGFHLGTIFRSLGGCSGQ